MVGKRCIAAGCSSTHKDAVHLCGFPKDPGLRKKWADQVKRTRDKWDPTNHSRLCSKHFEEHCFENYSKLSESMGLRKVKSLLKLDAVPTILERLSSTNRKASSPPTGGPVKMRRTAYEKRERARVSG